MKIHLLSGFLGSGKTTAIEQAARILLRQNTRIGVITNDQGIRLVDAGFFKSLDIPARQVVNGCFCCNYDELERNIESLVETNNPEMIFAESVGSCTDIVATVMKPLLFYRKHIEVTVSVFADARLLYILLNDNTALFDREVNYIYNKQLEEAGIIVINKIDLMNEGQLHHLHMTMDERFRQKKIIYQNSLDAVSLQQWLDAFRDDSSGRVLSSLDIDYDIYGAGEAKLAWLDEEISIYQSAHAAAVDALDLMNTIDKEIRSKNYPIGHLKFLLNGKHKISFTATSQAEDSANIEYDPSHFASLLINARVQTEPHVLASLVTDAIAQVMERSGCSMIVNSVSSFQPGYPRPTHRLAN